MLAHGPGSTVGNLDLALALANTNLVTSTTTQEHRAARNNRQRKLGALLRALDTLSRRSALFEHPEQLVACVERWTDRNWAELAKEANATVPKTTRPLVLDALKARVAAIAEVKRTAPNESIDWLSDYAKNQYVSQSKADNFLEGTILWLCDSQPRTFFPPVADSGMFTGRTQRFFGDGGSL